jgi:hypothetical protein
VIQNKRNIIAQSDNVNKKQLIAFCDVLREKEKM